MTKLHIVTISGHGQEVESESFIVPNNIYIHFWSHSGQILSNNLAKKIENNPQSPPNSPVETIGPGGYCPEHVLYVIDEEDRGTSEQNYVTEGYVHPSYKDQCIRLSSIINSWALKPPTEPLSIYWLACRNKVKINQIISKINIKGLLALRSYEIIEARKPVFSSVEFQISTPPVLRKPVFSSVEFQPPVLRNHEVYEPTLLNEIKSTLGLPLNSKKS